jgi:hypothetical protein
MNFDALNEYDVDYSFGTPLCGTLPANIGSACTVLNNSVVSVGGFDCLSAQRMQVWPGLSCCLKFLQHSAAQSLEFLFSNLCV